MSQEGKIDSVIGKGTIINGDIRISGSTKIDGAVKGSINAKESVILGKDANVKGDIHCKSAIIAGKIEGNIVIDGIVEFQSGAEMLGDVSCKGIVIHENVFFEGNCQMSQKSKEKK